MPAPTTAFPDLLRDYPRERLLNAFREAPTRIRAASERLTLEEIGRRARGANRWSIKEIVQHLADAELVGAVRLRLILGQEGATLPSYDQERWATSLGYEDLTPHDVHGALTMFDALRMTALRVLDHATEEDWKRQAFHPEWGLLSLRQWLELYADHGERHLAQILDTRARLGKPLQMDLLIPDRLY